MVKCISDDKPKPGVDLVDHSGVSRLGKHAGGAPGGWGSHLKSLLTTLSNTCVTSGQGEDTP